MVRGGNEGKLMKATLEFTLPEEATEHLLAVKAGDMASEIDTAYNVMRGWLKHGHTFADADAAIEACKALLCDAITIARGEA
jgi:hypothetical protein